MKKVISLVLVFVLSLNFGVTNSYAASIEKSDVVTATFDLTKGSQEIVTKDKDGNEVIIRLEKAEHEITVFSDLTPGNNSTWTISYNSIGSYAEFKMDVYTNSNGLSTISSVYDESYFISIYNISKAELSIPRKYETSTASARAEYYFEGTLFFGGGSTNGWLRADIKDLNITVSFK